jgi:hypothetical protein
MTKRVVVGVFLAVAASAITATVVGVVAQQHSQTKRAQEEDSAKIPPTMALKPSELTKIPPGTPVADLALPLDYGRFHILPPGSAPSVYAPAPTPPPGVKMLRVDVDESASLDDFRGHDLFFEPPYIPAGWVLAEAHAETAIYDDGSSRGTMFALEYQRPGYFYIDIARFLLAPDAQVELIGDPAEGNLRFAYTLGEIRGVPVVYQHQAPGERVQALLQVHFVTDNVVTFIEGVAIDFDELIKIADGLIAQTEASSS